MAALNANAMTLADIAKGLDPNGAPATVIELLTQVNEMLIEMPFMEGNLPTGHRTTVRTGLPAVYWRLINQGVATSKSTKAQVTHETGMLEAWSEVDEKLIKLANNGQATRASEARAFIEAMSQEMQSTTIYGNSSLAPEEFNGLAVQYSSLSADNAQNIINLEGTQDNPSDLTSIWLISWGEETVCGIFPKGSVAGLQHDDFGLETVEVTAGIAATRMRAYRERFQWDAGLSLRDWRYVVRICNIDISDQRALDLSADPSPILDAMDDAIMRLPNRLGTPVFYANRTAQGLIRKHARAEVKGGGGLTYDNVDSKEITRYRGIPIRTVDAILNTETAVA